MQGKQSLKVEKWVELQGSDKTREWIMYREIRLSVGIVNLFYQMIFGRINLLYRQHWEKVSKDNSNIERID